MTHKIGPSAIALTPKQATPLDKQKGLREKTGEAAEQFETMMALQMVRSMQSSLESGGMFGSGVSGDIYNGLAEWQLAQTLAKGAHFGLKEQILRQLPKAEGQDS
jgi:Rod binding domain-containing protein